MNLNYIAGTVEDIIREIVITDKEIDLGTTLVSDLGVDSFDMVLISNAIEDEFSIFIDDEFMDNDKLTVKDIVDKVSSLVVYSV